MWCCISSVRLLSGGSGLCDGSGSALRQGPEREVRPGPGPGGGRPRDGLLPPHDQRRHHGAPTRRLAALPQRDGTQTRPGELRVGQDGAKTWTRAACRGRTRTWKQPAANVWTQVMKSSTEQEQFYWSASVTAVKNHFYTDILFGHKWTVFMFLSLCKADY